MPAANAPTHYGSVAKTFHWLTALLVLTLIPMGIIANGLPYETSEELARKAQLFSLHKTLGVFTFFVALARIAWALTQTKPDPLHPDRKLESFMAELVHWLLYGSLLLVPLSGWIHHAATTGFAPIWWPLGQNLPFVPKSDAVAGVFAGLHIVFERVLALSILLHVAGALKHQFIDRDLTLKRMWFGQTKTTANGATHAKGAPILAALGLWAAALFIGANLGLYARHDTGIDAPTLAEAQGEWQVEEGHIRISVDQFGSVVTGEFADWTAAIRFDETVSTGPAGSADVTISIPSLTLGSVTSQAMGPDFFDAQTFPTARFVAEIQPVVDGYSANGTLTIKDSTLPVEMPFSLAIKDNVATLNTRLTLDRRDFGIGDNMADETSLKFAVDVEIALTASRPATGN